MDLLTVVLVAGAGAAVVFWLDSARARELATRIARDYCRSRGVQLLDGTAALSRIRLQRSGGRLKWQRTFQFDYLEETTTRRRGYLTLNGSDLKDFVLAGEGNSA